LLSPLFLNRSEERDNKVPTPYSTNPDARQYMTCGLLDNSSNGAAVGCRVSENGSVIPMQ